ncbi:MAG: 3-hydroxyacyl-CoA dehydrogenase family protein [Planctomycetota bacterium]|jgi:3-hydroxyacyl-CoA dehydrogenase
MNLSERLENVAIIGAAGKMGSGIALLLAKELARMGLEEGKGKVYRLVLVDVSEAALHGLIKYLRSQMLKIAEKSVAQLRGLYKERGDLVENSDMINEFISDALSVVRPSTDINSAAGARLVFEAVFENEDLKIQLLSKARDLVDPDAWFMTNTSSIPIDGLDKKLELGGRIVGYHFYNPPAVQKLLELITSDSTLPALKEAGEELAKRLGKKVIPANDIAGFIGNGHFTRDGLHAINTANDLRGGGEWSAALYKMNRVSQDWLLRPMGIFQLIDYVGVDVFQLILKVMDKYLPGQGLQSDFIDALVEKKILGGQNHDGSQKDGILKYEKGRPSAVYEPTKADYVPFDPKGWSGKADGELGDLPEGFRPWKALLMDVKKEKALEEHFAALKSSDSEGARLGMDYLNASKTIGEKLVADGVANKADDVNGVLMNGFFHLYGPINDYTG